MAGLVDVYYDFEKFFKTTFIFNKFISFILDFSFENLDFIVGFSSNMS